MSSVDGWHGARRSQFTAHDRAVIADLVSPETTYGALDAAHAAYFDRHGVRVDATPERAAQPRSGSAHAN